jgi:hypothetical protein
MDPIAPQVICMKDGLLAPKRIEEPQGDAIEEKGGGDYNGRP